MGRYARWRAFHASNPQVYDLFVQFAESARQAGRHKFGARMIWERLRWYSQVETDNRDEFRLNDHYPPYYARLLMLERPGEFGDFFELRDTRFDVSLDQMRRDFFGPEQRRFWDD